MDKHEKYMHRCLELAQNGLGSTYPNPLVGCVVVHNDRIIGEGWHQKAGQAHAEVNAIASVADKSLLREAELYVNLEPCSHHGRTPPCSDLIVKMGIPRVFIGSIDENTLVNGAGVERLQKNGCEVTIGVLEKECRELNKRFFTFHREKRPYVILKWAESSDGYIFPPQEQVQQKGPVWISNDYSRQLVHKWRAEEAAILVGTRTAIQDDPSLTIREVKGNSILRLIIDRERKVSLQGKVFQGDDPTIVFTGDPISERSVPEQLGGMVRFELLNFKESVPHQIMDVLYKEGIQSLIVEGGAATLNAFIASELWDEARVFIGEPLFGDGLKAPKLKALPDKTDWIRGDRLNWFRNEVHAS